MRILILLPLLAGCATIEEAGRANVTGNAVAVTVNNVWNANQAFPHAEAHCAKHGKAARPTGAVGEYAFTFDCVTP